MEYDEGLFRLSNQLEPSTGSEKLVVTLQVVDASFVPDTTLPLFSEAGVLKIVGVGM